MSIPGIITLIILGILAGLGISRGFILAIITKVTTKKNYDKRMLDLKELWDGNKITHKYGENFVYIEPKTYCNQPKGHFRYVLDSNDHSSNFNYPIDALLFFHTIKYKLSEIKYRFQDGEIESEIKVLDEDYEFLKKYLII